MKRMKNWIKNNIKNFNGKIKTEEDMKIKVLIPYLKTIGYLEEEMRFENPIEVNIGTKKTVIFSDVEIIINDQVELVIDAKKPHKPLAEKDVLQAVSYAKLVNRCSALYGIVTNGVQSIVTNVYTGMVSSEIPTRDELLRDIDKSKRQPLKKVEITEVEKILYTLNNPQDLYKVIKECKDIIEKRGLIRSDQSFREMTKILLVKMNEERRVKAGEGKNRFSEEYLKTFLLVNKQALKSREFKEIDVFNSLFADAKEKYPSIYTDDKEEINIKDNDCILFIVKKLESFSFLGTGDDIKGSVYEIFLKANLRGDFDQYFTPRELVDFMINAADPNINDIILDPACGSGGFLIQAFKYVNNKINASEFSPIETKKKFQTLVDKCLWGHEADYDLHVLAKINLIMHGDGWNNIYQGDTLRSTKLSENYFDLILANPPFTIPYEFEDVLSVYELGEGKKSEELDILFFEKSINLLKPGHDLFIVLPEGLLNIKKYTYFRQWLLEKTDLILSVSLPEGAFIPFGGSVSKTCILGVRKKANIETGYRSPQHVFLGSSLEIGYETGKKTYIKKDKNDLSEFEYFMKKIFEGIKKTTNDGECGWIDQNQVSVDRLDASYLLNKIDRLSLKDHFSVLVPLKEVCNIENETIRVKNDNTLYNYLEVPDISPITGTITNIRRIKGQDINDSYHRFYANDILFTRINPRRNRVAIAPDIDGIGVVSKEVYRMVYKENPYISYDNRFVICSILQSQHVVNQIIRLSTGSSSSRARVQVEDLLKDVYIPIPNEHIQKEISNTIFENMKNLWEQSQKFLEAFTRTQKNLGSNIEKNDLRSI